MEAATPAKITKPITAMTANPIITPIIEANNILKKLFIEFKFLIDLYFIFIFHEENINFFTKVVKITFINLLLIFF